jgi:RNA polymerase sigma-70 factor (ECF subfamily)
MLSPPPSLDTSLTLLQRLRQKTDAAAWDRFAQLYTPLLFHWARRTGLQESDAADLVQDVFVVLVGKFSEFQYRQGGSFRGWLRTVLINRLRALRRRRVPPIQPDVPLDGLADACPEMDLEEVEYRRELVRRALELLRPEIPPVPWEAFWRTHVLGRPVVAVAAELSLSVNAIYLARWRVMCRLRQEVQGFID